MLERLNHVRLTSTHNPRLQEIRRAALSGRPTADGLIVAEGPHLLEEVLRSSWKVEEIFCTAEAPVRFSGLFARTPVPVTELSPRAFESIATTEATQGVLALLRPREWSFEELIAGKALTVILDTIQDPGNAGTIARSAEAFGATGIILTEGCARVSNGKVLRAAAGSLFRIPYLEGVTRSEIVRPSWRRRFAGLRAGRREQDTAHELRLSRTLRPADRQ